MLLRPLFYTSFLLDDQLADEGYATRGPVLITSASSKTALAAAFLLRQRCRFAVRIRAPRPPVRGRTIARVPGKVACTRVRGRVALLRLVNQANEPVDSIQVRVGGRVVYRYTYPGKLRPRLRLRLPSRAVRVAVVIRTTSEKRFQVAQRYGACLPRRR